MKIGKTVKVVTSPKRKIQKVRKSEPSIPVETPIKVPEKVSKWKVDYYRHFGLEIADKAEIYNSFSTVS